AFTGGVTIAALANSEVGSSRLTRSPAGRPSVGMAGGRFTSRARSVIPGATGSFGFAGTSSAPRPRFAGTRSGGWASFTSPGFAGRIGGGTYFAFALGSGFRKRAGTARGFGAVPNFSAGGIGGAAGVAAFSAIRPPRSEGYSKAVG